MTPEENADKPTPIKAEREVEVVIYAEITHPDGLSQASYIEEHEQLESRYDNGTSVRVRKVTPAGESASTYIYTTKVRIGDDPSIQTMEEFSVEVNEAFFEVFKISANRRILKTRYYFESKTISLKNGDGDAVLRIPDVGYEVDVFKTTGTPSTWAKIDIEIDAVEDYLNKTMPGEEYHLHVKVSHLPFKPANCIINGKGTDEQKGFISNLWETEFAEDLRNKGGG